jgi:3-hydroxyacyl-CoA dehydrogenase/enoyl-CoA hydratase/carnithine racemase
MGVHIIDFSQASANPLHPLNHFLRRYILEQLQFAESNGSITSIVLYGGKGDQSHFSAGADLNEFSNIHSITSMEGPSLIDVVSAIDSCSKPVVACIDGVCLGGGFEVALACHYRIGTTRSSVGLPEVNVGVIPGAGGTQRLPRCVGLETALSLILKGQSITAAKALQYKIFDAVVDNPDQLLSAGQNWAHYAEVVPLDTRRLSLQCVPGISAAQAHVICHAALLSIGSSHQQGQEGLSAALEACRASVTAPTFAEGMQRESDLFLQVLQSPEGRARRHVFFAVRQAQKPVDASRQSNHPLLSTHSPTLEVAVVGAGTMGSGIAIVLLLAGFRVFLVDSFAAALTTGVGRIRTFLESQVKKRKLTSKHCEQMKSQLVPTSNLQDLQRCALIVEAIIENMALKKDIFHKLNSILSSTNNTQCILVSNTSTLDIDAMASVLDKSRRKCFAGWHFFSPAHIMKLVEIVKGQETSQETVALLQAVTQRIRKTGVVVGNCDGFCGNRLLRPYSAETVLLLVEPSLYKCPSIAQVDRALRHTFGIALGPFEMSDLAGNDIGYSIRKERGWVRNEENGLVDLSRRPARYTELADEMVSRHRRLGQKVGKGWYDYDPNLGNGRKPLPSPEMANLISSKYMHPPNIVHEAMLDEEIIDRVLYPLVNEGFKCLEEGIVRSPSDIDVVYVYGYGFPIWRGGPMYWADHFVTLPKLLRRLKEFQILFPSTDHYVPSRLLVQCVDERVTLTEYWRKHFPTIGKPPSKL